MICFVQCFSCIFLIYNVICRGMVSDHSENFLVCRMVKYYCVAMWVSLLDT